jgi:hypothetical protein
MWFSKDKLDVEVDKAIQKMESLTRENNLLKDQVEAYKNRMDSEYSTAAYSVDWAAMNAFSVERMWENGLAKTIIGYMLTEPVVTTEGEGNQRVTYKDVVREWSLYCSHTEHQRLVSEFELFRKGRP